MDPNAAWRELGLAVARGDDREAPELAYALRGWVDGGGFLPAGVSRAQLDEACARELDPFGDVRDGVPGAVLRRPR